MAQGQWGPLPVWPQLFGGLGGEAGNGVAHRQPMAARDERHQAARTALIRAIALAAYPPPTGQAVIVALRRAQRPVWAPGVRTLGRPPIIRRRSRTSSIVDRAGPVEWPNRENSHATGVRYAARAAQPQPRSPSSSMPSTAGAGRAVPAVCGRRLTLSQSTEVSQAPVSNCPRRAAFSCAASITSWWSMP